MLDRRFIREHPDAVKAAVRVKGVDLDVDDLLHTDQQVRKLQHEVDEAQARRKSFAKQFAGADDETRTRLRAEHEVFDAQLKASKDELSQASTRLNDLLLATP